LRTTLWTLTVLCTALLTFVAGYAVSSKTGVEPGYVEAAEAGGYGAGGGGDAALEGVSDETREYYEKLSE